MAEFDTKTRDILDSIGAGLRLWNTLIGGDNSSMLGDFLENNRCRQEAFINQYEAKQLTTIAILRTEKMILEANIFSIHKNLELYKYLNSEIRELRNVITPDTIYYKQSAGAFKFVNANHCATSNELYCSINR